MRRLTTFGEMEGVTVVTTNSHPLVSELVAALHHPERATATLEHLEECLACAVRFARLQRASGPVAASTNSLQRIVEASAPLPEVLADLITAGRGEDPQATEIWRVGRSEAVLVWVRQVFSDGVADVVPLVLDVDLADRESVIISAEATPLATELAAMVALRTHVHPDAFLNRIGTLDIRKGVSEVMTAVREGRRPSGVRVGPPIEDDDDQRLEYRQALRDVIAELSPSAWLESHQDPEPAVGHETREPTANRLPQRIEGIKAELKERLSGLQYRNPEQVSIMVSGLQAVSVLKVVYLDVAVLVVVIGDERLSAFPEAAVVAKACVTMMSHESDVVAVAIAIPRDDWPTQLFTGAYMRSAFELPGGARKGPAPALEGFGIIDTLCKYFGDVTTPWEVTEPVDRRIESIDYLEIAARHARASIAKVAAEGGRAHQAAKKAAWQSLPDELGEQVARFVVAVARGELLDQALADLAPEVADD
jgi:hypothetical protein